MSNVNWSDPIYKVSTAYTKTCIIFSLAEKLKLPWSQQNEAEVTTLHSILEFYLYQPILIKSSNVNSRRPEIDGVNLHQKDLMQNRTFLGYQELHLEGT